MRFSIGAAALADAVSYAAKAIPARPAAPIYAGLVMTAKDGVVTVRGMNDLTVASAEATVPADVAQEGVVLVPGRLFAEICAAVKSGQMEFVVDGPRLRLTSGKAKFALPLMPAQEYPVDLPSAEHRSGTVESAELVDAVGKVAIAAADPNTALEVLKGVLVELSATKISLTATDRYRMATTSIPWISSLKAPVSLVIPARQLAEALRGLGKDGAELSVSLSGQGHLILASEHRQAKMGAIDGDYPAVRTLIPQSYAGTATVDPKQVLEAVSRVALVGERNDAVSLTFDANSLALRCGSENAAGSSEETEVSYDGPVMPVMFNPPYLQDGLAACGSGPIAINLVAPAKPVVLSPVNDPSYTYLVMTVRPMVAAA